MDKNIHPLHLKPLALETVKIDVVHRDHIRAEYKVKFQDNKAGTVVDADLKMRIDGQEISCSMSIENCKLADATPDEVLGKLALWLQGFSATLLARNDYKFLSVPVFS
jgi:hypothetical protein